MVASPVPPCSQGMGFKLLSCYCYVAIMLLLCVPPKCHEWGTESIYNQRTEELVLDRPNPPFRRRALHQIQMGISRSIWSSTCAVVLWSMTSARMELEPNRNARGRTGE